MYRASLIAVVLVSIVSTCLAKEPPSQESVSDFSAPSLSYGGFELDVAMNRSVGLGLTHEEKLKWVGIRKVLEKTDDSLVENQRMRSAVRDFLKGIGKRNGIMDRAVVQLWFQQYRPDLAMDWMDVEITSSQRSELQKVRLSKKQTIQLRHDRLRILGELLNQATDKDVGESIGKPYLFVMSTLKQKGFMDFDDVPNCEPLAVLSSPHVQAELNCTISQVRSIAALGKEFVRKGYWVSDDSIDFEEQEESHLIAVRKDVIKRTEAILTPAQTKRFRQIVLQRYLKWDPSISPFYALEYLGGTRTEKFNKAVDQISVELLAAHRLRFLSYMKPKVQAILPEVDIEAIVGEVDYMSDLSMKMKPKLDNDVVRKLIHAQRTKNPRRRK